MKGNTRPACGLLPALQRRTVRALAAALVVGIGLAGVIWHEGLAALLRPIASGAGAVTTSGNGQPASFAYPGAPAAASLGATSSLVSTHVEAERHDPGVAGTGPGKEEEKEEPKREEDWAAAGIERDWGEDDDDDGFAELDMVEAEQQQEEEEAPRSAGGTDDAAAVHDMGDDDDDGMLKALEEEMAWKQKQNPEEIEQNESLARQHQQRSEEAEEAKRKVEQRRREEPVLTEEERAEQFLEECKAEFWERSFLPRGQEALPPILYSFPGQ